MGPSFALSARELVTYFAPGYILAFSLAEASSVMPAEASVLEVGFFIMAAYALGHIVAFFSLFANRYCSDPLRKRLESFRESECPFACRLVRMGHWEKKAKLDEDLAQELARFYCLDEVPKDDMLALAGMVVREHCPSAIEKADRFLFMGQFCRNMSVSFFLSGLAILFHSPGYAAVFLCLAPLLYLKFIDNYEVGRVRVKRDSLFFLRKANAQGEVQSCPSSSDSA